MTICAPSAILLTSTSTGPPAAMRRGVRVHLVDQGDQRRRGADRGHRAGRDVKEVAAGRLFRMFDAGCGRCTARHGHVLVLKVFWQLCVRSTVAPCPERGAPAPLWWRGRGFVNQAIIVIPIMTIALFWPVSVCPQVSRKRRFPPIRADRGRNFPAPGQPTARRRRRPWRGRRRGRFGSRVSR